MVSCCFCYRPLARQPAFRSYLCRASQASPTGNASTLKKDSNYIFSRRKCTKVYTNRVRGFLRLLDSFSGSQPEPERWRIKHNLITLDWSPCNQVDLLHIPNFRLSSSILTRYFDYGTDWLDWIGFDSTGFDSIESNLGLDRYFYSVPDLFESNPIESNRLHPRISLSHK
jgi:hypothetical protein